MLNLKLGNFYSMILLCGLQAFEFIILNMTSILSIRNMDRRLMINKYQDDLRYLFSNVEFQKAILHILQLMEKDVILTFHTW